MTSQHDLIGSWTGEYSIWFEPGDPVSTSPSELTVKPKAHGGTHLEYTWAFKDDAQTGSYEIAPNQNIDFADSFHTPGFVMECKAKMPFDVVGSFEHEGKTFGWNTIINTPTENFLEITAYYVDGDTEQLATRATYKRV